MSESRNTAVVFRALEQSGGRGVGRSPAGLSDSDRVLATPHTEHARDRARETGGVHVPAHAVHVPTTADRGGHGRAPTVPRDESHAPPPPNCGPPLDLDIHD